MVGVNNDLSVLANLDTSVLVALGILAAVQLMLAVTALVALWRTPVARLRYLNHWGWTAVIVLVNIFGAAAFFFLGRRTTVADAAVSTATDRGAAAMIVAQLYGGKRP